MAAVRALESAVGGFRNYDISQNIPWRSAHRRGAPATAAPAPRIASRRSISRRSTRFRAHTLFEPTLRTFAPRSITSHLSSHAAAAGFRSFAEAPPR